jgi:hypothetical protein
MNIRLKSRFVILWHFVIFTEPKNKNVFCYKNLHDKMIEYNIEYV